MTVVLTILIGHPLCEDNIGLDVELSIEYRYDCNTDDRTPAM